MKDEHYVFYQDVKEKKSTARSAYKKKSGKRSKKCTMPSDYLSKKEREAMNSECKTWNMNKFYTWEEFKQMPADIAGAYLTVLNQKYHVSMATISTVLFHISHPTMSGYIHKHGIIDFTNIKKVVNRGDKEIREFENAIAAEKILEETGPKTPDEIFIPAGMAPGYCSDGTKVEDAIKEAEEKANKKLLENGAVSLGEAIDDLKKELGVPSLTAPNSWGLTYEPIDPPITPFKPTPSAIQQAAFTIHGWDFELMEYIQDMFRDCDVTIHMTVIVNE